MSLKEVAKECRLSARPRSHAFRVTIGGGTHKSGLLTRRVEVAKEKLRDRRLPLSDAALACDFADQSHLTRVFTPSIGLSPCAWRRMRQRLFGRFSSTWHFRYSSSENVFGRREALDLVRRSLRAFDLSAVADALRRGLKSGKEARASTDSRCLPRAE